ncbi:pE family protein [Mycobacterium kansasii]|uniref:PE family protein n=1 Tax=Mycobacterium kansasii TaxID=1768 RepID=A0A1V3XDI9_MYCKA|nr:pE family protein [Mycobacterium kansasii]
MVGTAAAALAELIVEPMLAKSVAAEATISGIAITNDIRQPPLPVPNQAVVASRRPVKADSRRFKTRIPCFP